MATGSDDVVTSLRRWELFGGRWQVLRRTESDVTVVLLTCDGGQEMSQVTATSDEFEAFLGERKGSEHR
jgi:anti-sigma factor ChrR (cupin superfamily)